MYETRPGRNDLWPRCQVGSCPAIKLPHLPYVEQVDVGWRVFAPVLRLRSATPARLACQGSASPRLPRQTRPPASTLRRAQPVPGRRSA
jgi:hypothetical protein